MVLSRTTVGAWHRITGSTIEVLTELNTAGISPDDIAYIASDASVCTYRRGV
jgi:hypothetical protein